MSDSLVRVSRRAEWGARRPTPGARWCRSTSRRCVLGSTIEATTSPRAYRRPGLGPPPRSASVHAPSRLANRPIRVAFPNNPTRRQRLVVRQGPGTTGLSPSQAPLSRGLGPGPPLRTLLQTTIRAPRATDFQAGLFPAGFDNDPSAGSPTETLLRLLLPLNDKVQWTSGDVAGSEPPTSRRSDHFTGPFNRLPGPVGQGYRLVEYISVARVRPRTSKGITDLLLPQTSLA
ncbi:hypothetical protein V6N13_040383 [Hibiscus sabdariffa]